MAHSPIIVALDYHDIQAARELVDQLDPKLCQLKIGNVMFTHYGTAFVSELINMGFDVFLDLKYHDIPNTVAGACRAAADLGAWMINVHVQGGSRMLRAAREAVDALSKARKPLLIGVTVLTSMEQVDLDELGCQASPLDTVKRLTELAVSAKLDGVVCSAEEAVALRQWVPKDFLLVTPGIRLPEDAQSDQRRVVTPEQAIQQGADYLVIGRSITQSSSPLETLQKIQKSLSK